MSSDSEREFAATLTEYPENSIVNKIELAQILGISTKSLTALIDRYEGFPIEQPGSHGVSYKFRVHDVLPFLSGKTAEVRQATCLQAKLVEDLAAIPLYSGPSGLSGLSGHQRLALARARLEQRQLERFEGQLVEIDDINETMEIVLDILRSQIAVLMDDITQQFGIIGEKERFVREQIEDLLTQIDKLLHQSLGIRCPQLESRLQRDGK